MNEKSKPIKILTFEDIEKIRDEIASYRNANECDYEDIYVTFSKDGSHKISHGDLK